MGDKELFERYSQVYPDRTEQQLKDYIYYQRLVHERKNPKKNKKQKKEENETVEVEKWITLKLINGNKLIFVLN